MIVLVDYGVGNLFSLKSSLEAVGAEIVISGDENIIRSADKIILPGVGAFADAAKKLSDCGLDRVIISEAEKGKYILGICLGMQLLFDKSLEYGEHRGLGLISGEVRPIAEAIEVGLKIPHIGWNALGFPKDKPKSPIFKYLDDGDFVYFVHSYYGTKCSDVTAVTEYGGELTAAVGKNNIFGTQFHPEKSGDVGLNILKAFCEL